MDAPEGAEDRDATDPNGTGKKRATGTSISSSCS
jgi:hypothetical protein